MHRILVAALLIGTALPCAPARAQNACRAPGPDCAVIGEWDISIGFGLGERTNPISGKSDIPLLVLPQVSYYGERFFLDNLELGFTLHESYPSTFNLIAAPGYDRVFFLSGDLQNVFVSGTGTVFFGAVPDDRLGGEGPETFQQFEVGSRSTTYLVGPEWLFNFGPLTGQVGALREVTGKHEGYEVRSAVAMPIIQAKQSLVLSAGLTWKSSKLVGYYYGIDGLYEPGSALNPFLKLAYAAPLAERWTFSAFVHYEQLDGSIARSPIVAEDRVLTAFVGFIFKVL